MKKCYKRVAQVALTNEILPWQNEVLQGICLPEYLFSFGGMGQLEDIN